MRPWDGSPRPVPPMRVFHVTTFPSSSVPVAVTPLGHFSMSTSRPLLPSFHVPVDSLRSRTLLIKPVDVIDVVLFRFPCRRQTFCREMVAQKIESPAHTADKRLVGVLPDFELIQHQIDDADSLAQCPPCRCQDNPVNHESGIGQPVRPMASPSGLS